MKNNRLYYCFYCIIVFYSLSISFANAQEAVSPNGKFATVKGIKIYYEDTGKGLPLILIHGWTQTASAWKPFIPELSKSYRVITIDIPGHGRSDGMDTTEVYSFKRATGYIFDVLDQLHIDSANVIGISAGAFITLYMATMKPQFTKSIILIGGQTYFSIKERNIITAMAPRMESPDFLKNMIASHGKQKGSLISR